MTNRSMKIVATLAVAGLLSALGAPGASAQGPVEVQPDSAQINQGMSYRSDDASNSRSGSRNYHIQVRTPKTSAVVEGDTAWVTVSLRGLVDVDDLRFTAALAGQPVAYPENTVDHSGPYNGYALDRDEIDYVAFQITAPQIEQAKQYVDFTISATWTGEGERREGSLTIAVPVIEFSGEPYELVTDDITITEDANGWVNLAMAGLTPRIEDVKVSIVEPSGLDVHYPQETYTSLLRDAVLEDGETDEANLRLGEAHWGQTIDVEIRIDYVVDAEPLTRTHKVTITS